MLTEEEVGAGRLALCSANAEPRIAIRELLRLGLAAEGVSLAGTGSKSKDFGVIPAKPKAGMGSGPRQKRRLTVATVTPRRGRPYRP
jgi:hypothetical protein